MADSRLNTMRQNDGRRIEVYLRREMGYSHCMKCRSCIGLITLLVCLPPARAAELRIRLENPPRHGGVILMLYDSPNAFGDLRDPVLTVAAEPDGMNSVSITNIPPGEYALVAYHDENGNGEIDRNFIGIPREPLGFANNYKPKGPPGYAKASFILPEDGMQQFTIELNRPLGPRGRIGAGAGVIWRSSPYRDYNGGVYRVIPAITYTGDRFQWFGPRIQYGLAGGGKVRLAAVGEYRIGVYEEDGSDYLAGMGDAESTFMAGLALQAELPGGVDLSLEGSADALNRIGGMEASIALDKSFQFGLLRLSPRLAANWMDEQMAANDYGVPAGKAAPDRPAYDPGASYSTEAGIGLYIEITTEWLLVGSAGVERLDHQATDSPLIDKGHVFKGFAAVNYAF